MATKVISVKPEKKPRKTLIKKSTDDRIRELRRELGLDVKWEKLKFQMMLTR